MPGLIGLLHSHSEKISINEFFILCKRLSHSSKSKVDPVYFDENLIASRVHNDIIGERICPVQLSESYCWIDGEIYNAAEIAASHFGNFINTGLLLLQAYLNDDLSRVVKEINGFFNAVIYDSRKNLLTFITDRLGLKHLYIWSDKGRFAWSSELKGFIGIPGFDPVIDPRAVECFLKLGYIIGNFTWFKNVSLIPASTIITYDFEKNTFVQERYWTWKEIKPRNISKNDAIDELRRLWRKVVHRCYENIRGQVGLSLSGGLDSRSILAFSQPNRPDLVYTFGKPGCDEIKIARKVCRVLHQTHTTYQISKQNWFCRRKNAIWRTDGQITCLDLHESPYELELWKKIDLNINGFIGDLVFGGSWTNKTDSRISLDIAQLKFGHMVNHTDIENEFFDALHVDPYYIDTRARRFTIFGIRVAACALENRLPYTDNEIIEFIYSLPDYYRLNYKLTHLLFLSDHPDLFKKIPWHKTGYSLRMNNPPLFSFMIFIHNIIKRIRSILNSWGLMNNKNNTLDRKAWLVAILKKPSIIHLLLSRDSIFSRYISDSDRISLLYSNVLKKKRDILKDLLKDLFYLKSGSLKALLRFVITGHDIPTEELGRYLTMEIWFQQLFQVRGC